MEYFLDASTVVKYYATEPGSSWVRRLIDHEEQPVLISHVTIAEVSAALGILERVGRLTATRASDYWDRFLHDASGRLRLVPVDLTTCRRAADLCRKHPLKAYDAVQVAVSLALRDSLANEGLALTFVSGDSTQLEAAEAEGLTTDDPFDHTDLDEAQ